MRWSIRCASLCLILAPLHAVGQVAWEAPPLIRSGAPSGLSIFLTSADPGDGLGVVAGWRAAAAPDGVGFRVGVAEEPGGDVAALFGVDFSGALATPSGPGAPSVMWWTGAGVGVGTDFLASFPLGFTVGWTARDQGVSFMPYLGGHVVLDVFSGPGDDLDLDGALDLGLDLGFPSGFMIRFGASVGGRDALAIGVRLPTG
jgi:hypothetical protein